MKTKLLIAMVAGIAFAPALPAHAQYKAKGNDGIVASPKLRQKLNEREAAKRAALAAEIAQNAKPCRAACCGPTCGPKS